MRELCFTGARALARLLRARKVSAAELMQAFIAQIERVNPRVNAIVTFVPEQALKAARALDRRKSWDAPLAGLPIAYKDLVPTKGIRTTFGSAIYADQVPAEKGAGFGHRCRRARIRSGHRGKQERRVFHRAQSRRYHLMRQPRLIDDMDRPPITGEP